MKELPSLAQPVTMAAFSREVGLDQAHLLAPVTNPSTLKHSLFPTLYLICPTNCLQTASHHFPTVCANHKAKDTSRSMWTGTYIDTNPPTCINKRVLSFSSTFYPKINKQRPHKGGTHGFKEPTKLSFSWLPHHYLSGIMYV